MAACDQTLIVTSYGRIGSELNALNQTSWIATAYRSLSTPNNSRLANGYDQLLPDADLLPAALR